MTRDEVLVLFDVDGTLTEARQVISEATNALLRQKLMKVATVGLVSGSDLNKVSEQMGGESEVMAFDYVFPENGLVAYKDGTLVSKEDIASYMGEDKLQRLINFCLDYMSKIQLPIKRGNFIEFRNGLINICPIGRSCSQEQRLQFHQLDQKEGIRKTFVETLRSEFADYGMQFAIGGQISIDAYPDGWDKRFCLNHLQDRTFKEIHFFGDRTAEGGNDFHLYNDPRTLGHTVTSPQDTMDQLTKIFNL